MRLVDTVGMEKPLYRAFIGLKLTQPAGDKQEPPGSLLCFATLF